MRAGAIRDFEEAAIKQLAEARDAQLGRLHDALEQPLKVPSDEGSPRSPPIGQPAPHSPAAASDAVAAARLAAELQEHDTAEQQLSEQRLALSPAASPAAERSAEAAADASEDATTELANEGFSQAARQAWQQSGVEGSGGDGAAAPEAGGRTSPEREALRAELASVRSMIEGLHTLRRAVEHGDRVQVGCRDRRPCSGLC